MNPDTNHLVDLEKFEDFEQIEQEELMKALQRHEYQMLADNLQHAAKTKLNGEREAHVSKTSGGKLSKWAANQRKMQRNQNR